MSHPKRAINVGASVVLFGVLAGVLIGCGDSETAQSARSRPNLVFILADDLDDTTMPFWDAMPRTKELTADRGLEFTNAFATNPVCCPARASILTGKYSHNTGVFDHTPPDGGYATFVEKGVEQDTLATRLQQSGYTTAFIGKYLNGYEETPEDVPVGWDEWFGLAGDYLDGYTYTANHNGKTETYGTGPENYQTDVLSKQAEAFVDATEARDDQPFLLFLAPSAPHQPIAAAPRHAGHEWATAVPAQFPNYDEQDVSDKPTWLRDGKPPLDAEDVAILTKRYRGGMGSLLAVDEMVSSLADQLRASDELEDTVFVLTSDNGNSYGAHRLENKQVPYEESISVPLVIAGPAIRHGTEDALATHIDYTPTLLDLAGVDAADLDGRSLVPLFEDTTPPWRNDFLIEYHGTYRPLYTFHTFEDVSHLQSGADLIGPPTYRALRNESFLYVEWYAGPAHEYELYDLDTDPYQLENLIATEQQLQEHQALVDELQLRIDALGSCSGPTCRS